jgi:hypothetical protein
MSNLKYWEVVEDLIAIQEAGLPFPLSIDVKAKEAQRVYTFMNYTLLGTKRDYAIIDDRTDGYGTLVKASKNLEAIVKRLVILNKEKGLNDE